MVAYQAAPTRPRAISSAPSRRTTAAPKARAAPSCRAADITVAADKRVLRAVLAPKSSPHRTRAIAKRRENVTAAAVVFPGTRLRLVYAIAGAEESPKRPV